MRRKKLKKKNLCILLLIIIIFFCLIIKPKNYHKEYKKNNYTIYEEYNKNKKEYYFKISNDNISFDYYLSKNKFLFKKVVKEIKEYSDDKYTCIIPIINKVDTYPLCYSNVTKIDYHLVSNQVKDNFKEYIKDINNKEEKYNNINIYNLVNKSYLIWNYHNFISINNNKKEEISLFNKDYYDISLAAIVDNYLVIPNYDQEYNFKEFKIINLKNLSISNFEIPYEISYESYILGVNKKSIFLVDKKNKIEYEYVPSKKKIRIVGTETKNGTIYNDGFEKISLTKLVSEEYHFTYTNSYDFIIENNMLFMTTKNDKTLITNHNVDDIIYKTNDYVFYKYGTAIYYYDKLYGEIKVMDKFEWNFNYKNIIFVY